MDVAAWSMVSSSQVAVGPAIILGHVHHGCIVTSLDVRRGAGQRLRWEHSCGLQSVTTMPTGEESRRGPGRGPTPGEIPVPWVLSWHWHEASAQVKRVLQASVLLIICGCEGDRPGPRRRAGRDRAVRVARCDDGGAARRAVRRAGSRYRPRERRCACRVQLRGQRRKKVRKDTKTHQDW